MRNLLLILVLLSSTMVVAQKNNFSIGANTSFSYNKITGGVEISKWKNINHNGYIPLFTFKISYGLLGYKTYKFQNNIPDKSKINNYQNAYYNYYRKDILKGIDASLIKEFKINHSIFFGIGIGWNGVINKGYDMVFNPFINDTLKIKSELYFQTISALSNVGYLLRLNKNILLKSSIQFFFFFPLQNGQYIDLNSSMPNVGVEGDLSISINYLF